MMMKNVVGRIRFVFSHQGQKRKFFKMNDGLPEKTPEIIYPDQYPKNLEDTSPIVPRGRPVRYLTPKREIVELKMMPHNDAIIRKIYNDKWQSPQNAYGLNVGLIGPVNSGKSQLLARLSHKVSAVSPKANTTTQIITALKSYQYQTEQGLRNVQLKYLDTPGLMYNKTGYLSRGWKVLGEIDFSLLIIDCAKRFDDIVKESIHRLQMHRNYQQFMKALVLNKIDLVDNKRKFHSLIAEVEKYGKFDKIFYTSALTGYGIDQLQQYLLSMAKPKEWQNPKQAITQSNQIQIMQQMLREGLFYRSYKQIPHKLMLECISFAHKSDGSDYVEFKIYVQNENQQRMIIGTKGRNISWVIDHFKVQYAKLYKKEVTIEVRVVIKANIGGREELLLEERWLKKNQMEKIRATEEYFQSVGKVWK